MPLFSSWGYPIVFAGVFLESIFLTGWIAPGTTVILLGAFFAAQGELNILMLWATSVAAALLGDNVGYFIGRKIGREAVERYDGRPRLRRGMERSQRFFSRHGGVTVLFGRMLSGLDAFIPLTAGLNAMPYRRYMAYDIPAAMIWSGLFSALGYFFGDNWQAIDRFISRLGWGMLGVVAAAVAAFLLVGRHRRGKRPVAPEEGGGRRP